MSGEGVHKNKQRRKRGKGRVGSKLGNLKRTYFLMSPYGWSKKQIGGFTILLPFRYFISLETANTQKSEVFLLSISLGNVDGSIVTYQYLQIYNFSFRKQFLETLCKCNSRILTQSSTTPFVENNPTSCVSSL